MSSKFYWWRSAALKCIKKNLTKIKQIPKSLTVRSLKPKWLQGKDTLSAQLKKTSYRLFSWCFSALVRTSLLGPPSLPNYGASSKHVSPTSCSLYVKRWEKTGVDAKTYGLKMARKLGLWGPRALESVWKVPRSYLKSVPSHRGTPRHTALPVVQLAPPPTANYLISWAPSIRSWVRRVESDQPPQQRCRHSVCGVKPKTPCLSLNTTAVEQEETVLYFIWINTCFVL